MITGNNTFNQKSRRAFIKSLPTIGFFLSGFSFAKKIFPENQLLKSADQAISDLKITRIRFYQAPSRSMVNQSAHVGYCGDG